MNERRYDVVIIGSGAGGGTVAQELAPLVRDGRRVLVLEKGARFRDDEFSRSEYTAKGPYVRLGLKVDQDSVREWLDWSPRLASRVRGALAGR